MPSSNPTFAEVLSTVESLRRRSSLKSILSRRSSLKRSHHQDNAASYYPYAVYNQPMAPPILRNLDVAEKLLEAILDSPNGKRTLARLARTCRDMAGLSLGILWRELDSLLPIVSLFPASMLKRARRPGLGLTRPPTEAEWDKVLKYGQLVKSITYDEVINNVHPSIFAILDENKPTTYIFPNLATMTWRVTTPAGLERASPFLSPGLKGVVLDLGSRLPLIHAFLADLAGRTQLEYFSFTSPFPLPHNLADVMASQNGLKKLVLLAPGALTPGVGRWVGAQYHLVSLTLDVSGRTMLAAESFFEELRPQSRSSTPSTDSGVFSGDEWDTAQVKPHDRNAGLSSLRSVTLTGDIAFMATFLKNLGGETFTSLDLIGHDFPSESEWQKLSRTISEEVGPSLRSLRISGTRVSEAVKSPTRMEALPRLSLQNFHSLTGLQRFEIDLPESVIFTASDIAQLATACPNIQEIKLCPLSRFPALFGGPRLLLEDLAPLMSCSHLHTLSIAINARKGSDRILGSKEATSQSLLRLHVGHSWVNDSLQVAILLSHLSPHLESLKWFHEKNRPGFIEANALGWERVLDILPHLQAMRRLDRVPPAPLIVEKIVEIVREPEVVPTSEKAVDATVVSVDRGILARPRMSNQEVQVQPTVQSLQIQVQPNLVEVSVNAVTETRDQCIESIPSQADRVVQVEAPKPSESSLRTRIPPISDVRRKFLPILISLIYRGWMWMLSPILSPCSWIYAAVWRREQARPPRGNDVAMEDLQVGA